MYSRKQSVLDLIDKDFKSAMISMLRKQQETMSQDLKEVKKS